MSTKVRFFFLKAVKHASKTLIYIHFTTYLLLVAVKYIKIDLGETLICHFVEILR